MGISDEVGKTDKEILKELEQHPLFQGDGRIVASNGASVSWRGFAKTIRIHMMGCPEQEVEEILATASAYRSVLGRRMVYRTKIKGLPLYTNADKDKCKARAPELLELFGKMYSGMEVHKIIVTEWKLKTVDYKWVLKFQRENSEVIGELKEAYQKDTVNVRLVHKRSRLDELTDMYGSRKSKYEQTQTRSDYELMLKTLEQIRKEVEGQQIHINGRIQVEHEQAVQDHVNREIMASLNINDIIVGRLCARLGVNPKYILYRLHTSYYSKFTGFLPDEMNDENEINYPSQIVYDFTRIAAANKALEAEDIPYKEEEAVVDPPKMSKLKEKLMTRLKEKQKRIKEQANRSNSIDGKKI